MITGYNDNFNRTVASGFGTATSGQVYTVVGTASQYNVTPGTATILPTALGDRYGWVDRQTSDIDITGQVALSAIPATNLMTVGFVVKRLDANNYYNATMMVAAGGAISLRFSKVVGGGLTTIATVATGLTYVANTFYNLRVAAFWSNALQANVLQSKLWVVGGTEPGGWIASANDAGLTQYTTGPGTGPFSRDEATVAGAVTAKIQNVAVRTYSLPIPAGADTMCADPAVAYPKQTALESLADATDAVVATLDPFADLAQFFPRVRVSNSNWTVGPAQQIAPWTATEFNIGTATNLGYDPNAIYLPIGIWVVTIELQLLPFGVANSDMLISFSGSIGPAAAYSYTRANTATFNLDGQGGSTHVSAIAYSTDAALNLAVRMQVVPNTAPGTYTVRYSAMSAIKISDYFA